MNQEQVKFFSCALWNHFDSAISGNAFKVETILIKDPWNNGPLRLKFEINHSKNKTRESMFFDYQTVYSFLTLNKQVLDNVGDTLSKIQKDHDAQVNISISNNKKKMFITFLYKLEYIGPCVRIVISEKNENFSDSEKVYMPYLDFLSLIKLLVDYRNSYFIYSSNILNISLLDDVNVRLTAIDEKIESYYKEMVHLRSMGAPPQQLPVLQSDPLKSNEVDIIQQHFQEFVSEKTSEQTLDLPSNFSSELERPKVELSEDKNIVKELLSNNIQNLEVYLNSIISDISPFNKFCEIIKNKTDVDVTSGMKLSELNAYNYYTSLNIKNSIQQSITRKMSLPKGSLVFIFDSIEINDQKINLLYDLLLFLLYYSNVRNILIDKNQNVVASKDMIVFILKNLTISFIINLLINKLDPVVIISNIQKRYQSYKEKGIFQKLEEELKTEHSVVLNINSDYFTGEIERISKSIKGADQSQLKFPILFNGLISSKHVLLDYSVFHNNNFTIEQIKKLLVLEFNFRSTGKVEFDKISEFKDFSDLSKDILEKFGITNKRYNNDNLKRFLTLNQKTHTEIVDQVNSIVNESYRDLKDKNIDLNLLDELSLKSIYLWDILKDSRVSTDFLYFDNLVRDCSLTKDVVLSLLTNIQKEEKIDVINQFIASRED